MKQAIRYLIRFVFKIIYRVEVINREAVPAKGAVVLCSNHVRMLDMFFIGFKIPRLIHYMAKAELFRIPVINLIIKYFGTFPVKRGTADIEAIKTAIQLVREGHIVGTFPEGHRSKGKKNKILKAKPGAAMIAVKGNVPVLPVALQGDYRLFSKVRVVFGEPYYLSTDSTKKYTSAELSEMSANIMKKVYSLMEE
ncbi:MAG: lysophospholipid acyltransferase family protein [Bacillota bacterium]|nr:lysophospholipid acyltransferase family protein [Bacillota bacterium]